MKNAIKSPIPNLVPNQSPPCQSCSGHCCKRGQTDHEFAVLLDDDEVGGYPEAVANDQGWMLPFNANGSCIHLDGNNQCRVYDRRPNGCRQFSCLDGWKLRGEYHGFFLEDSPEVVVIIEARCQFVQVSVSRAKGHK